MKLTEAFKEFSMGPDLNKLENHSLFLNMIKEIVDQVNAGLEAPLTYKPYHNAFSIDKGKRIVVSGKLRKQYSSGDIDRHLVEEGTICPRHGRDHGHVCFVVKLNQPSTEDGLALRKYEFNNFAKMLMSYLAKADNVDDIKFL